MVVTNLLVASAATAGAFATYKLAAFLLKPVFSPLRELRGPKGESLIWGDLKRIWKEDALRLFDKWEEEYGPVFVFKVFFNVRIRSLACTCIDAVVRFGPYEQCGMWGKVSFCQGTLRLCYERE